MLRLRIITVATGSANLDVQAFASQVLRTFDRPSDQVGTVASQLEAACETARAVLSSAPAEGFDALDKARRAAEELIVGLQRDTVRRDIANQVQNLRAEPDTIGRLEASVVTERSRPSTDF